MSLHRWPRHLAGRRSGTGTSTSVDAQAQSRNNTLVLAMMLEPPGLDPTTGAAAAIGEMVHYNILEGLTKINMDGTWCRCWPRRWTIDPDGKLHSSS